MNKKVMFTQQYINLKLLFNFSNNHNNTENRNFNYKIDSV